MSKLLLFFASLMTAQGASDYDYRCQIVSMPDLHYETVVWNGAAPQSFALTYDGQEASIVIEEIGLAGHPEYLFSFRIGNKTVLGTSQKRDLPDYNITWRNSDLTDHESLISLACRRPQ